ncbi:hypothetical protein [Nocardia sp. NPDC049149]|uniref:hypothetical protein n=1 Tax=Nocardia sp. NPDC049149 TaxID=3364315 RepID=UPI00371060CE
MSGTSELDLAEFEDRSATLTKLLLLLERDQLAQTQPFHFRQKNIDIEARDAYDAGDFPGWRRANGKLDELIREVAGIPVVRDILSVGSSPEEFLAWISEEIDTTDQLIHRTYEDLRCSPCLVPDERARLPQQRDQFLSELQMIVLAVEEIDLRHQIARELLHGIYVSHIQPLEARINLWGPDIGTHASE